MDPARAAEAQAGLTQLLRLVNILSGSMPGPNMGRDGTRDVLLPRIRAVEASITSTGAEALMASRCTPEMDFFEAEPTATETPGVSVTPDPSASPIGVPLAAAAAPAAPATAPAASSPVAAAATAGLGFAGFANMGAAASTSARLSLAADALTLAERQAAAIITWGATHAAEVSTWWDAFANAIRSLIGGVAQRALDLRDAASATGRNLRDFFSRWASEAQRRFDQLATALGIGAGVGAGAGILFLIFLILYAVNKHH